jgi:hypothetical protein
LVVAITAGMLFGALVPSLAASPAGANLASNATALPGVMGAIVVDAATSQVFVSMPAISTIAVLDFDGKIVATIAGEAGADGMVLDGSHLYVVASTAGSVDDIDTRTLTRTRTLATGIPGIAAIAAAAGSLWVVKALHDGVTFDRLVRISRTDGATTEDPNPNFVGDPVALRSDPGDPNVLFEFAANVVARLDVSTDPPTLDAWNDFSPGPPMLVNIHDVAVSPDGAHLYTGAGSVDEIDEIHATTLLPTGVTVPARNPASAVATTSAAGGLLAYGSAGVPGNPDGVAVYRLNHLPQLVDGADLASSDEAIDPGGLAFSPDGVRVFAVSGDQGFTHRTDTFHVVAISGPPPPVTSATVDRTAMDFRYQRIWTHGAGQIVTIRNTGDVPVTVQDLTLSGKNPDDFSGSTDCFAASSTGVIAPGASCRIIVFFAPLARAPRSATLTITDSAAGSPHSIALRGWGTEGYYVADPRGLVDSFGDAQFMGSAGAIPHAAGIVAIATTANGDGYWLLARDGGVFSFGDAAFYGSTGAIRLNRPITGIAPTRAGHGYWLVASDGGIFSFGDARFFGSTGSIRLNQPIVGMAVTPSGHGYWLVASDGGIFSFGDARFFGSTGNIQLNQPIVGMIASPTGGGYLLVARDGGVFAFGDARFSGSAASRGESIAGVASAPDGRGYWMVSTTGDVFAFGDAESDLPNGGDIGALTVTTDAIGIAATAPMIPADLLGDASVIAHRGLAPRTAGAARGRHLSADAQPPFG